MKSVEQEFQMYGNFNELAKDVLDLAKEILPDKLIYLTSHNEQQQHILKMSHHDSPIRLQEGDVLNSSETICNRMNFAQSEPLKIEDINQAIEPSPFKEKLVAANIRSYLGLPIKHFNGDLFGTLCVVHDKKSHYDSATISLLQKIVRMFTYYLELERRAYHDELTGLYNRHYLKHFFEGRSQQNGTLLFLDLDGFKRINDAKGHDYGDEVLKRVASRLEAYLANQKEAFGVRLGGDEFVLHFAGDRTSEEIQTVAKELLPLLSQWENGEVLSASIGATSYKANQNRVLAEVLRQADRAMYQAKLAGKNTYFYE